MSSKYDVESALFDLLGLVQANLPTKITEINTEKNDSIVLDQIPNESYYNERGEELFNKNTFVFYSITNIESIGGVNYGTISNLSISIDFEVFYSTYNEVNSIKRILRYSRALKECLLESFDKISSMGDLIIQDIIPADISFTNSGSSFKVGGVTVQTNIAV